MHTIGGWEPTPVALSVRAKVSKRGDGKNYFAEIVPAYGPLDIQSGHSFEELFRYKWVGVITRTGEVELHQQQNDGSWELKLRITDSPVPGEKMRHLGLVFDQAGRPVIAFEHEGYAQIYVRQYDPVQNTFIYRGPFDGVDPVLLNDAVLINDVPDSDVLMFYLDWARKTLNMRVQREQYDTEHEIMSFYTRMVLDQVVPYAFRINLLGSKVSEPNEDGLLVASGLYPVNLGEDDLGITVAMPPSAGVYYPIVIVEDVGDDDLGTAVAHPPSSGIFWPLIIIEQLDPDSLGTATVTPPDAGNYRLAVVVKELQTEDDLGTATAAAPDSGTYRLAVVVIELQTEDDLGTATVSPPSGGTYEAV